MSIFTDLGRRLRGWPLIVIGPGVAALLTFVFSRIKKVVLPDWIFLALIVGLWLAVVYVFWYIRQNEKSTAENVRPVEAVKPTEEVLFILGKLAGIECDSLRRGDVIVIYDEYFKGREADEFAAVIGILRGHDLIRHPLRDPERLAITDKGSAYYLAHKERKKKR